MDKKAAIQDFLNFNFSTDNLIVENAANEETLSEIRVFGEIWEGSLYDFDESLQNVGSGGVEILINSPGGSVFDGVAMAAMVKRLDNNTTTTGIGFVASIASVLLLAANKVRLNRDAFLMIHNAWAFEAGEAKEMRKTARILDKISNQIANVYVAQIEKAGKLVDGDIEKTKERVKSFMDKETWFTAQEALDFGLIDEIAETKVESEPTEEEIELIFNKYSATAPTQFLNKLKNIEQMSDNNENKGLWNKILDFFKAEPSKVEDLQNELKAQSDAKIQEAIEIAKENGFYKEPVEETTEEAAGTLEVEAPVVENNAEATEETTEEVVVEETVVEENAEILALKAQNEALQKQMKAIEEKLGSPSAGDGSTKTNPANKTNEQLYAPTKEAKSSLDAFSKLFQ